jgi:arsenate reductase (thioredoxin)
MSTIIDIWRLLCLVVPSTSCFSAPAILPAAFLLRRLSIAKARANSLATVQDHSQKVCFTRTQSILSRLNYDVSKLRSKSWEEFDQPDAPELDFVFTVCDDAANEACPHWPGQPMTAHWGLPDPAAAQGNEAERRLAFADTYRMLNQRISIFVNLPLRSLDQLSLQRQLNEIGKAPDLKESA